MKKKPYSINCNIRESSCFIILNKFFPCKIRMSNSSLYVKYFSKSHNEVLIDGSLAILTAQDEKRFNLQTY